MEVTDEKRESDMFNQVLMLFEKLAASSPTLIFDFLIFDIRSFNLTGKHLLQNREGASSAVNKAVAGKGGNIVGSAFGFTIFKTSDGQFQGINNGGVQTPKFSTTVEVSAWIIVWIETFGLI